MVDVVEASLDVTFDHIGDPRIAPATGINLPLDCRDGVVGASTTPEAERGRIEVRLEDRLQNKLQSHLYQAVFQRRDAQRSEPARLARLRYPPLPDRLWPVGSIPKLRLDLVEEALHPAATLFDLYPPNAIRAGRLAARVAGHPTPGIIERSAVTHQIEHVPEPLVRGRLTPPIQFALHVEDKLGIHRAGLPPTSCRLTVSAAPLRHVNGFPALGLLRGLRPTLPRSSVASIISGGDAATRFLGSIADLSPAVGTDFTPCGNGPATTTVIVAGWHVHRHAPLGRTPQGWPGTPLTRRSSRPLPRWRQSYSNEASDIGSIALPLAGSLAGTLRIAEVHRSPALAGSAHLWLAGSTRFTSPARFSPRAASRWARGPPPRKVSNSF